HQVDVVVDDHDVTEFVLRIHPAGRVGHDERVGSERFHHADRKRDLLQGVAFVEMEAAFHRHDRHAAQHTANQLPGVRLNGRCGEVRNVTVANDGFVSDLFGQTTQT